MPVEENIQLMRRWFQEVWNDGRIETVHELFSANGIATGQAGAGVQFRGPEEFVPFVKQIRGAFPDIKVKIEDVFGAEDKVALRWSASMTHARDSLGVPATGKTVCLTGITIARFDKGKVVEGWLGDLLLSPPLRPSRLLCSDDSLARSWRQRASGPLSR